MASPSPLFRCWLCPKGLITDHYESMFSTNVAWEPMILFLYPESKAHAANMGPIWGRQDPGGPHVGPMIIAIWVYTNWPILISKLFYELLLIMYISYVNNTLFSFITGIISTIWCYIKHNTTSGIGLTIIQHKTSYFKKSTMLGITRCTDPSMRV